MAWTNVNTLSAVELAIYIACVPLVIYTAIKHRAYGKLGHLFLFIFMGLRVVGDGLAIHQRDRVGGDSTVVTIINSVGISPLIISAMSFVGESRAYLANYDLNRRKKYISMLIILILHSLLVVGIALLAIGLSDLSTDTSPNDINNDRDHAKTGAILVLVVWIALLFWDVWSLSYLGVTPLHKLGGRLLIAVTLSLLFIGVRVIYMVVVVFQGLQQLEFQSFGVRVAIIFLMQLLGFLGILTGLLFTRNIDNVGMIKEIPLPDSREPSRPYPQPYGYQQR